MTTLTLSYVPPPGRRDLPSAEEMAELDRRAIACGTPALVLMERAAQGCVNILLSRHRNRMLSSRGPLILCGPGNNGGDGLAIARILHQKGLSATIVLAGASRYSKECLTQLQRLQDLNAAVQLFGESSAATKSFKLPSTNSDQLDSLIVQAPLILDALLGNGQKEAPRGSIRTVLERVVELSNSSIFQGHIIAIDIPTGIASSSGECFEPALSCNETLCIELIKRGLVQSPAREKCGEISIIPIGITQALSEELHGNVCSRFRLLAEDDEILRIRERNPSGHKRDFGSILVVGGSKAMPGASILSAHASLRSGAGLVRVTQGSGWHSSQIPPELMVVPLGESFSRQSLPALIPFIEQADVVVLGPGLGVSDDSIQFFKSVLSELKVRDIACVLDADGLNILSLEKGDDMLPSRCVLTPHPGEAARLLGTSSKEVQGNRYTAAELLFKRFQCTIVLKGSSTIVLRGAEAGSGWVNLHGNPYMATAGSGDVLSGLIATYLAQSENPLQSACQGVFIHSICGDLIVEKRTAPLIASDLIEEIPRAMALHSSKK